MTSYFPNTINTTTVNVTDQWPATKKSSYCQAEEAIAVKNFLEAVLDDDHPGGALHDAEEGQGWRVAEGERQIRGLLQGHYQTRYLSSNNTGFNVMPIQVWTMSGPGGSDHESHWDPFQDQAGQRLQVRIPGPDHGRWMER